MRILTKNMRNVYVEAHRRAMKEYYPPHLTGPGSRGVGLLDMVFFASIQTHEVSGHHTVCSLGETGRHVIGLHAIPLHVSLTPL